MSYRFLILEKKNHIAVVTMNRPEKLNSMNVGLRDELVVAFREIAHDDDVRVAVLTGAGRAFCAGGDVGGIQDMANASEGALPRREIVDPMGWNLREIERFPKPLIAAVNGVAAGTGFAMVLMSDIRVASEKAKFVTVFVRRGMIPDSGMSYLLPRLVGDAKAAELLFMGDDIDPKMAKELGIVSRVVLADQLMPVAMELAAKIAAAPPVTIELTKKLILKRRTQEMEDAFHYETFAQRICFSTEDTKEGVRAFLEKRPPNFKGR